MVEADLEVWYLLVGVMRKDGFMQSRFQFRQILFISCILHFRTYILPKLVQDTCRTFYPSAVMAVDVIYNRRHQKVIRLEATVSALATEEDGLSDFAPVPRRLSSQLCPL